jgi:hypothetical protein
MNYSTHFIIVIVWMISMGVSSSVAPKWCQKKEKIIPHHILKRTLETGNTSPLAARTVKKQ